MGGGIYLIQDEDHLVEMMEQSYDSEERLQELIEKYPNLLAGDQIDRSTPRWWLGITREITSTLDEEDDNSSLRADFDQTNLKANELLHRRVDLLWLPFRKRIASDRAGK